MEPFDFEVMPSDSSFKSERFSDNGSHVGKRILNHGSIHFLEVRGDVGRWNSNGNEREIHHEELTDSTEVAEVF